MRRLTTPRRALAAITTGALVVLGLLLGAQTAHADTIPPLGQHVAVPAYIPPTDASWNQLSTSNAQLAFVVANVANGPDTSLNTNWQTVINATHNHGTKVLGYVDTGYFGFTTPARQTVLGDTDATAWLVQAEQDITAGTPSTAPRSTASSSTTPRTSADRPPAAASTSTFIESSTTTSTSITRAP